MRGRMTDSTYVQRYENPDGVTVTYSMIRAAPGARIVNSRFTGPLFMGRNVSITDAVLGRYNGFADNASVGRSEIGSYCCVAAGASINPFQHPTRWLSAHGFQFHSGSFDYIPEYAELTKLPYARAEQRDIRIGNDVWIGHSASVMASVGDGAVIGAGAVVTKDVPPYAVVAGVPAALIRFRFDSPAVIARLLRLRWWDMELSELDGLPFDDIDRCLDLIEGKKAAA